MKRKKLPKIILVVLFLTVCALANAEEQEEQLQETLNYLAWINMSSLVEPSGSVGSYGVPLGVGVNRNSDPIRNTEVLSAIFEQDIDSGNSQSSRVNILKGTEWPIDLGFSANQYDGLNIMSLAMQAQFTLFEGFRLPAVSLRLMASRLYGVHHARVSNEAAEFALSYGLLRYLKIFSAIRSERAHIKMELNQATVLLLDQLSEVEDNNEVSATVKLNLGLFGVKIPLTETISFVGEAARSLSQQPSSTLSGKISIIL